MPKRNPEIEALVIAAAQERHSPLYRAMRENYAAMEKAFRGRRPDWAKLVEGFTNLGITDGNGEPPKIRAARATWYRVKRDMARAAESAPT